VCSQYVAVTHAARLLQFFGAHRDGPEGNQEVFPTGLAPFIRLSEDGSGNRVCDDGHFGLLPHFAAELAFGRKTYNARSETVHEKPSFREAWRKGRRCIIPAELIYEPSWETGKAVRWAIQQPGQTPMGIAGIWSSWKDAQGTWRYSFAMLTVNADGHPVFKRMHRPTDEKRMVVIIDPAEFGRWLACSPDEAKTFFKQWLGPLDTFPAPLPPRGKVPRTPPALPSIGDDNPHLFD
jgi:putative SOS response-associated peptidase YedK